MLPDIEGLSKRCVVLIEGEFGGCCAGLWGVHLLQQLLQAHEIKDTTVMKNVFIPITYRHGRSIIDSPLRAHPLGLGQLSMDPSRSVLA